MFTSNQIGVEALSTSVAGSGMAGTVPASITPSSIQMISSPGHQVEIGVLADVSGFVDRVGGHGQLVAPMRISSTWEAALLVILFVMVGGLVAIRVADAMAARDIDVPSVPSLIGESDSEESSSDSSRTYEHIVPPDIPSELLSDEGQVVRLLVESEGRIRQHEITERTGWSKSKVSRILSRMYDDGMIEKASIGRENVITLSEVPTDDAEQAADKPLP